MITIVMSSAIAAEPQRVWRALTDPSECIVWDENRLSALDPDNAHPESGKTVRWRYQLGSVPIVMRERAIEVIPCRKLHTQVTIGSLHFDQTLTLALEHDPANEGDRAKTILGMKIAASNSAPVLGGVVDRFEVRRITVDRVDASLRAITKWCESGS